MTSNDTRRASLSDIQKMDADGALWPTREDAEVEELGPEFWARAKVQEPKTPRSVRLNLDPDVFDYFKKRGRHITRMQEVLKAYVRAHHSADE